MMVVYDFVAPRVSPFVYLSFRDPYQSICLSLSVRYQSVCHSDSVVSHLSQPKTVEMFKMCVWGGGGFCPSICHTLEYRSSSLYAGHLIEMGGGG